MTQSFTLQPGWNSIFLEVQPDDTRPAAIFAGLPIEMVWSYFPTTTPLEYIQNPSEGLWNVAGWNVYLPSNVPDAKALTNLFAIQHHRPYLIKVSGANAVTLTITGTPLSKGIDWRPDSFTLTGLPLDPAVTVRSGDFFFSSPAHKSQRRFRLDPNGIWIELTDSSILNSGVAYWIFSKGASDFNGPVAVGLDGNDHIEFGSAEDTQKVDLQNTTGSPMDTTIANPNGAPIVYSTINPTTGVTEWKTLTSQTITIPPVTTYTITLGTQPNGQLTSNNVLTISTQGVVQTVAVTGHDPAASLPNPNTGLWIGSVTLNSVSEAHSAQPNVTTTTPAEFSMRLILHVDGNGTTRLLKEVIQMQRKPTPGAAGAAPIPGPFVLISDPALISSFQTPGNHDGARFAPRVSSVGYDFNGVSLALNGSFGGALTGNIVMPRNSPTNPFKHRYHPDHDDLTEPPAYATPPANLPVEQQEVWEIARALEMTFAPPPSGDLSPGANQTRTGTYKETLSGLHKKNLITAGTFTLKRVDFIADLNPTP